MVDGEDHSGGKRAKRKSKKNRDRTFVLTRIVFLRLLGLVFFTAFAVAFHQNPGLIGDRGLTPASEYWKRLVKQIIRREKGERNGSFDAREEGPSSPYLYEIQHSNQYIKWFRFLKHPTLLWFLAPQPEDVTSALQLCASVGMALSNILLVSGRSCVPIQVALWLLYFTINDLGQRWYGFGWESQLLETAFLAIFLVPLFPSTLTDYEVGREGTNKKAEEVVPRAALYCLRWLDTRLMIGAGLIKLRGDACWRDLTCMDYHYETQPVPNPLSWYLHHNPHWVHQLETLINHLVELILPVLGLLPHRQAQSLNGVVQIGFQMLLILSGNLSFLNWLSILPALAFLDDQTLMNLSLWDRDTQNKYEQEGAIPDQTDCIGMKKIDCKKNDRIESGEEDACDENGKSMSISKISYFSPRLLADVSLILLVAFLSIPVVLNMLQWNGRRQVMNGSFDAYKIVNTYGAFGSITKIRQEVVLEYTVDGLEWLEVEFKCKPGDINRRPCIISPYHHRLDWLMWFAGFGTYQRHPWMLSLTHRLLNHNPNITSDNQYEIHDNYYQGGDYGEVISLLGGPLELIEGLANGTGVPLLIRGSLYEYKWSDWRCGEEGLDEERGMESGEEIQKASQKEIPWISGEMAQAEDLYQRAVLADPADVCIRDCYNFFQDSLLSSEVDTQMNARWNAKSKAWKKRQWRQRKMVEKQKYDVQRKQAEENKVAQEAAVAAKEEESQRLAMEKRSKKLKRRAQKRKEAKEAEAARHHRMSIRANRRVSANGR